MIPPEIIMACGLGAVIGIVAALLGVGGGFFYVPALIFLFGLDPRTAVGTSLAIITCTTLSATAGYARQGRVLFRSAICLAAPAIIFAVFGAYSTTLISPVILQVVFALVLSVMGIKMLYRAFPLIVPILCGPCWREHCRVDSAGKEDLHIYPVHLIVWGGISGYLSGLTGVGGGIVNVPAMAIAGIPIHFAVATSAAVILISSLAGTGTHLLLGHLSLPLFLAFAAGAIIGAQAGVKIAPRTEPVLLERAVGILLLVTAAIMVGGILLS